MDPQTDKQKEREKKLQIKTLEKELKIAYKSGQPQSMTVVIKSIQTLDPQNRLAGKVMEKVEAMKKKEEAKAKEAKAKEYEDMLKQLYKAQDVLKLKALAAEFIKFDPESRSARAWVERAEKLAEKLSAKTPQEAPTKLPKEAPKAVIEMKKPIVAPTEKKPAETSAPAGNIFTKMFGKKEEEVQKKSIIDTIVATSETKVIKKEEAPKESEAQKPVKAKDAAGLLTFSKIFLNFSAVFIVLSAMFLYVEWIDKQNTMLGFVGVTENTGGRLYHAATEMDALKEEETALNKEIELYKGGYDDKTFKTVQDIVSSRINWPDIFTKINEVTNSVYELNDFFKYIEYNNYSFDAENSTIRVTGTLSDPQGRNLTKLVELEEAFKYYPKDKNNPDDPTKPYFTGFKELTSLSKSLDTETGRYNSSFQLSFSLNKK